MGARIYASGARRPRNTEQLEAAEGVRLCASGARRPRGIEQPQAAPITTFG